MVNTSDILPNTPRYLKVPLIFFNAILWILGVILIALGGYALHQLQVVQQLISISIPAGIIVLGVFIVVLTVVGCAVAYKEKLVGLIFYTVVMLVLLVALIGVGGGSFTYREQMPVALQKAWVAALATKGVDEYLQKSFSCCGWVYNDNKTTADSDNCVIHKDQNITVPCENCQNETYTEMIPIPQNCTTCVSEIDPAVTQVRCHNVPVQNITEEENNITVTYVCTYNEADDNFKFDNITSWRMVNGTNQTLSPTTQYNPYNRPGCSTRITPYVQDRLYVAAVAGIVVGVIEFVCMLFSLFLIVRLCRSPRARSYD